MKSNYLQVLRSALSGLSQLRAARQYRVSRNTVSILVQYAKSQGWTSLEDLDKASEEDLARALNQAPVGNSGRDETFTLPDYEYVHAELGKPHVTLKMLWEEYVESCLIENKRYYRETQFRYYYGVFAKNNKATIRLNHKPGLAMHVDWAGSRIAYYDAERGELSEGHLFVAVLPCSNLAYSEVFRDEKLPSWIRAHTNCFQYLDGVPKTIVPDNLKTGVEKADFYEPVINRSYQEMADHYGTVILPARVRKPKDKASGENMVKIASQRILGRLRNKDFNDFYELRQAVEEALEALNSRPLTGKNMSRWDAFLAEEKDYLLMLPTELFELSEWKEAKVQPNCHIAYQGHFYSVPFEYTAEAVDIRATQSTVEVFYHHQRIASHRRLWGRTEYSTVEDHMPPGKLFFVNWDRDRFLNWAGSIGVSCRQVTRSILDRAAIEQQAYRSCFGLLSLKDKYSSKRLEDACALLLQRNDKTPTYSQVKRILEQKEDLGLKKDKDAKAEGAAGLTKSMAQTVYPSNRKSYTLSLAIASENLEKLSDTSQVGVEVEIEYEDGSVETRFIDLY